jgi:hypothetical protein
MNTYTRLLDELMCRIALGQLPKDLKVDVSFGKLIAKRV